MRGFNFVPIRSDPMLIFLSGNRLKLVYIIKVSSKPKVADSIPTVVKKFFSMPGVDTLRVTSANSPSPKKSMYSFILFRAISFIEIVPFFQIVIQERVIRSRRMRRCYSKRYSFTVSCFCSKNR